MDVRKYLLKQSAALTGQGKQMFASMRGRDWSVLTLLILMVGVISLIHQFGLLRGDSDTASEPTATAIPPTASAPVR